MSTSQATPPNPGPRDHLPSVDEQHDFLVGRVVPLHVLTPLTRVRFRTLAQASVQSDVFRNDGISRVGVNEPAESSQNAMKAKTHEIGCSGRRVVNSRAIRARTRFAPR